MRTWHLTVAAIVAVVRGVAVTTTAQTTRESHDMTLLGFNDLQRAAPISRSSRSRRSLYRLHRHHAGSMPNLLTGKMEDNGTSVVDVTTPRRRNTSLTFPESAMRRARPGADWCVRAAGSEGGQEQTFLSGRPHVRT